MARTKNKYLFSQLFMCWTLCRQAEAKSDVNFFPLCWPNRRTGIFIHLRWFGQRISQRYCAFMSVWLTKFSSIFRRLGQHNVRRMRWPTKMLLCIRRFFIGWLAYVNPTFGRRFLLIASIFCWQKVMFFLYCILKSSVLISFTCKLKPHRKTPYFHCLSA